MKTWHPTFLPHSIALQQWLSATMICLALNLAEAADLKPACRGLMIREYRGQELWPFMDSVVVHVLWKDLETADGKFDGPGWDHIEKAHVIDDTPKHVRMDFKPTFEFANWARQLMGQRLVLQNNGTGADAGCPNKGAPNAHHFCYLAAVEGPKGFQTRTVQRLGGTEAGLLKTLDNALRMGANFVELPSGYQKFSQIKLKEYDARLRATK